LHKKSRKFFGGFLLLREAVIQHEMATTPPSFVTAGEKLVKSTKYASRGNAWSYISLIQVSNITEI
jgi:hypothetical protein